MIDNISVKIKGYSLHLSITIRYEIQLFTMYENKESAAYISTNFTTQPNTPGRFIVWFRNETTLLVLWQPPYPAGVYSEYKVRLHIFGMVFSLRFSSLIQSFHVLERFLAWSMSVMR